MSSPQTSAVPLPTSGRALQRLSAGVAHTVNNALTGVVGYLELALRETPGENRRHLEAALACAHNAAEAVRRLVAFCAAPAHVDGETVALRDIAESAARMARNCGPAGITVITRGEKPARVTARGALVSAAVEMVVRNALEAMPDGGRLILETEEVEGRARLWVRDSGPGIPPEVQERLFEPFVTTKNFGHLGLGLALASELVRAQDGNLSVSSGAGTTITFSFPAVVASDTATRCDREHGSGGPVVPPRAPSRLLTPKSTRVLSRANPPTQQAAQSA